MALYATLRRYVRTLVRAFFREIEVTGLEHVPREGGGIIVSWHPNGLVDPALIVTQCPRRVVFGARAGLFKWPLVAQLIRGFGTVPIHRAADSAETDPARRRAANQKTLGALAQAVADGDFAALFPEGVSHDQPGLTELKTGVARLYYQAREQMGAGAAPPAIVPVGLFYDRKHRFRSRALVAFHPPLALPPELDVTPPAGEDEDAGRERCRALMARIEQVLEEAVGATEDWPTHDALHQVRKLLVAERHHRAGVDEPPAQALAEEAAEFAAVRRAYYDLREREPKRVAALRRELERYRADLHALGLEDADLDRGPPLVKRSMLLLILMQAVLVYLLLPPLVVVGIAVNGPVALLIRGLAFIGAKLRKDQATIKLLAGALFYPLAWGFAGWAGYALHNQLDDQFRLPDAALWAGLMVTLFAILGGVLAVFYLEFSAATARSLRVRLTRWQRLRSVARLRLERSQLRDQMVALAEGRPEEFQPEERRKQRSARRRWARREKA